MNHPSQRIFTLLFFTGLLFSCSRGSEYAKNGSLSVNESVELTICGASGSNLAIENVISAFNKIYPNCHIAYEPLQNYSSSLQKRLSANDHVDLFINDTLSSDLSKNPALAYADNVYEEKALDLSHTYQGLNDNSALATGDATKLYYIPFGGEIRGLFVNKTLLSHQGLSVPKNYKELLSCCEALAGGERQDGPNLSPPSGEPGVFFPLFDVSLCREFNRQRERS